MKILLAPLTVAIDGDADQIQIQNLIDVLRFSHHEVAVCAPSKYGFHHAERFEAPTPNGNHFFRKQPRTYEDHLYQLGALDQNYLEKDYVALANAIDTYQPELIIEYMRPQSIVVANNQHVRCVGLVHAAMVRERRFHPKALLGMNRFLATHDWPQILKLKDLYYRHESRIAFGPQLFQPFPEDFPAISIGTRIPNPSLSQETKKVVFIAGSLPIAEKRIKKHVSEAFLGAPYDVEVFIPNISPSQDQNIHYQASMRLAAIQDASICIHDGTSLITDCCLVMGVPQLIINDTSWQKSWNAAAVVKSGVGLSINYMDFDMASLYENYRRIIVDPYYKKRAQILMDQARGLGDLTAILKYLQ